MADRVTGRREFWLTSALILFLLLVFYVLPPPPRLDPGMGSLDQSWQAALVHQFLRHAQCGPDLVFTYGPWGFLAEPRGNPAIHPWLAFGRFVLAIGVSAGTAFLVLLGLRSRTSRCLWLLWFLALASPWIAAPFLLYMVVFETSGLTNREARPALSIGGAGAFASQLRFLTIALLVPACALGAHVKLVALPLVAALGLLILLDELFFARRIPCVSAGLAACYAAFYFAAGQHAASFLPYLRGVFATISGYGAGMALEGPALQVVAGTLFCLLVLSAYIAAMRRRGFIAVAGAAWVAAYFFMAFKQAFVRQDGGHIWAGILMFAVPASLIVILFAGHLWSRALLPVAAAVTVFFAWTTVPAGDLDRYLASRWSAISQFPRDFQSGATLQRDWREDLAEWRQIYPIAPLTGSADILPTDILTLLASSAVYRPRPVIQSYAAVNPYLARLNANFLAGPRAPDFVLLNADAMDGRYPSTEDNLAWLGLLARYQPAGFSSEYLILRKSPQPAPIHLTKILERAVTWDQDIELDSSSAGPVWAEIDLQPEPLGRLIDFLFRPPEIDLNIQSDGVWTYYMMLVPLARSGFLLSPVVENPAAFALLYRADQDHRLVPGVSRISITAGPVGQRSYRPQIAVRLYRFSIPPSPVPEMLDDGEWQLAGSIHSAELAPTWDQLPTWSVASGNLRLQANAPAAGSLPYDGAAASLDVAFGIANQCPAEDFPQSRVEFRVSYRSGAGSVDRMLLRRTLEARDFETATAAAVLPLPKGMPGSLQFATTPLAGNCRVGAYWSRVTLR
jgi:hypothetical protein